MSSTSSIKGVQLKCPDANCLGLSFDLFINFQEELIFSECTICAAKLFAIPLSPEEALNFEKEYIEQEIKDGRN